MSLLLILLTLAATGSVNATTSFGRIGSDCDGLMLQQTDIADLPESVRGLHSTYRLLSLAVKHGIVTTVVGATDDEQSLLMERLGDILTVRQFPFVQIRPGRLRTNVNAVDHAPANFQLAAITTDTDAPPASELADELPGGTVVLVEAPSSRADLTDYAFELVALFEWLENLRAGGDDLFVIWTVPHRGVNAIADAGKYRVIFDRSDPLVLERNNATTASRLH